MAAVGVSGCGSVEKVRSDVAASPAATVSPTTAGTETVEVWLRPQLTAAEKFAAAVSTPGNPRYRHFLTPDAYAARFGSSARQIAAVATWLRARGFTRIAGDGQRDYVRATAMPAAVEAAFDPAGEPGSGAVPAGAAAGTLRARRGSARVPWSIAGDVLGVTESGDGASLSTAALEDATRQTSEAVSGSSQGPCGAYYGRVTQSGLPSKLGTTTFPIQTCGLTGQQLRSAYGANSANTGTGQTIVFAEAGGLVPDMFQTLKRYAARNHLPPPSAARFKQRNLQPASCKKPEESTGEEQMDVESAYAIAPGAIQLVVGADLCDTTNHVEGVYQPALDADIAIIDGNGQEPMGTVVSNSWETGFDGQPKAVDEIETAYLVKAASVGVGMYFSSGDQGCTTQPASNPYATGVGGTMLAVNRSGQRLFETGGAFTAYVVKGKAWQAAYDDSYGGGQSLVYGQPSYQKGVVPRSMSTGSRSSAGHEAACKTKGHPYPTAGSAPVRSAPDVSADALTNFTAGKLINGRYTTFEDGGTSLSAPLVASMVIDAQQHQRQPFGFINPALYKLAGTSALYDPQPLSAHDPVSWRAQLCPKANEYCGGTTTLWLLGAESSTAKGDSGQVTAPGYDDLTGVGVPHGQAFIKAMRKLR